LTTPLALKEQRRSRDARNLGSRHNHRRHPPAIGPPRPTSWYRPGTPTAGAVLLPPTRVTCRRHFRAVEHMASVPALTHRTLVPPDRWTQARAPLQLTLATSDQDGSAVRRPVLASGSSAACQSVQSVPDGS
jgi:hypothetical protein